MNIFFDTSALVKYFHEEAGTDIVTELINVQGNKIYISELARLEFVSALHRRYHSGEIDDTLLNEAMEAFVGECANFHVEPVSHPVMLEAEVLLLQYGKKYRLRALDAIQLATFSLLKEENWMLAASDDNLLATANAMGAQTFNPLA